MSRAPLVSTSWNEGRVFDLWMLVHFGTGVAGGFSNVFFGLSATWVYALGLAAMVLWEIIELVRDIRESPENRAIDIGIGLFGVFTARMIASAMSPEVQRIAFGACAIALTVGCVLGWRAYVKRVAKQKR